MRILIVGGGGREHALAWRLAQGGPHELFASPGNPGIAEIATCLPAPDSIPGYAHIAEQQEIELTLVGPEAPLVEGIVDRFRARGLKIVGPTAAAAKLEGSKNFAKQFLLRAGIPTARSSGAIKDFSFPVVIKADGLAAGKGVVIARDQAEAGEAVERLGPNVVIEEFLDGEEVSFIGLSDGESIWPFTPSQDHKRVFDGDRGPNTGGMGAYCDSRILSSAESGEVMERIMLPAIHQMRKEGTPFTGFLYAGLMMTAEGPKVLEFNVRLGDPETQALMYSFEGDLADVLIEGVRAAARSGAGGPGSAGTGTGTGTAARPAVCIVLAAQGYPEKPRRGDAITGIREAEAEGATVFHAGTKRNGDTLVASGGRVLGVTADGETLQSAIAAAYRAVEKIHFDGMHYRKDIGLKGLERW
jgi:phosphoribosylamine---glycine ligase